MESHFKKLPEINIQYTINMNKDKKISTPINHIVITKYDDESWIITCKKVISNDNSALISKLNNKLSKIPNGNNETRLKLSLIQEYLKNKGITNPDDNFKIKKNTPNEHNDIGKNSVFYRIKYPNQEQWHLNLSIKTSDKVFNDTMIELAKDNDTNKPIREPSIEEHVKITGALRKIGIGSPKQISELVEELCEKHKFKNKTTLSKKLNTAMYNAKNKVPTLNSIPTNQDSKKIMKKAYKKADELLTITQELLVNQTALEIFECTNQLRNIELINTLKPEIENQGSEVNTLEPNICDVINELSQALRNFKDFTYYTCEHELEKPNNTHRTKENVWINDYISYLINIYLYECENEIKNWAKEDGSMSDFIKYLVTICNFSNPNLGKITTNPLTLKRRILKLIEPVNNSDI
jgi:hypothetical protein